MKKTILFILVLFIFGLDISYSQTDDNGAPYFPLRVGNAFYYKYYHCNPGGCDSAFVISRITQTKIFNGRRYYYVSNLFGRTNSNVYLRYNSSTGYLVYLDTTNAGCNYEMAIYNLSASIGDSVSSSCRYGVNFKCKSIVDSSIFGTILRVKKFGYYATSYGWITEAGTHFARQRGCLYDFSATYNNSFAAYQRFLQGCKINGVVYGDTIDHVTPPSYADSARYFPLLVGNSFYYKYYYYFNSILADSAFVVSRITGTISKNNKSYFVLTNFAGVANVNYYLRYDTTNGKLMKYDSTNSQCSYEKEFYNFIHIPRDSSVGNCAANLRQWCEKIKDTTFFNLQKKSKQYNWMTQSGNYGASKITYFIKDFGISSYHDGTSGIGHTTLINTYLTGAKINGTVYGDTTTVTPPLYADSSRYFPLKIGNKYYYKYNYTYHRSSPDSSAYDSSYYIVKITDTSRFHGKLYYKMNSFIAGTYNYFRHDLDSGFLVAYDSTNWCTATPYELKCFMLRSNVNQDGSGTCWINNYISRCFEIHDTSAFGSTRKVKGYFTMWGGTYGGHYYTWLLKDIGLCQYEKYYYSLGPGIYTTQKYKLTGAFIDGVKYGDTNTVGINSISNVVPDKYALYQNYPNPFNPTTIIKYQIPPLSSPHALGGDPVLLKVYDILGKEIATLINEKQSPGLYEVTFDASQYPSGIYFYKLETQSYKETKKMLLIK